MSEFNLIDEAWIPCIALDGTRVEYGIRDTLVKAHELREICDDSPLVTVALHRMLLAILYRAYRGPGTLRDWSNLYAKGEFASDDGIEAYLQGVYSKFFLFDYIYPFMQVVGLDLNEYAANGTVRKDKSDGLMRLAREAPDKGGKLLFDHRTGTERPLYTPEQITKMILSAQCYLSTGVASRGKIGTQQIHPANCQFCCCLTGVVLWLQGKNLFQTLLLNLVPQRYVQEDKPAWEDDNIVTKAINSWTQNISFTGSIQRFVPLSRFIRVIDKRSMFFTNGFKEAVDCEDPMITYSRKSEEDPYSTLKLDENKAAWRDAHTLLTTESPLCRTPACINHMARLVENGLIEEEIYAVANIVGLATNQGKCFLWRHERMPVPISLLLSPDIRERLSTLMQGAEQVGRALSHGLYEINKKVKRKEPVGRMESIADLVLNPALEIRAPGILRTKENMSPGDAHNNEVYNLSKTLDPRPAYWARMETHFYELLEHLPGDWNEDLNEWKPEEQQLATLAWRRSIKREAQRALEESIRALGTTAKAIQAVARVCTTFGDSDLNPTQ